MHWNGGGHALALHHLTESGWLNGRGSREQRVHETQKPLTLMLDLVSDFTDPGELIWDPYCGSGTTGVACLRLGRRFVGHEMQPHYAEVACERLRAEEDGQTLHARRAGQTSLLARLRESDG